MAQKTPNWDSIQEFVWLYSVSWTLPQEVRVFVGRMFNLKI